MDTTLKIIFAVIVSINYVDGHGRVMEPPNRSSLWRLDEYKNSFPEPNYDDNQVWCGGIGVQYEQNGGKCGPCGDAWNEKRPRENEDGGRFGRAIIARNYTPGQVIHVSVELTANHLGHFEFNLCPLTYPEDEECFQKYPLFLADGSGTKYMVTKNGTGFYNTTLQLPKDLKCKQCSLRWHYRTANRWNFVTNTTGEVGAGDQEIFRTCSDITIGSFPPVVPRPPTHSIPEEMKPTSSEPATVTDATTPKPVTPKPTTITPKPTTPATKPTKPQKPATAATTPKPVTTPTTTKSPTTTTSSKPHPSMPAQRPPSMPAQRPPSSTAATTTTTTAATTTTTTTVPTTTTTAAITTTTTTMVPTTAGTPRPVTVTQKPGSGFPMQRPPKPQDQTSTNPAVRPHPTMKPPKL